MGPSRCRNAIAITLSQHFHTKTNTTATTLVWLPLLLLIFCCCCLELAKADSCPPSEAILPCRCSLKGKEIQIWCSHSNLPQIMDGIKSVERNIKTPVDELVLENNQLPALPGRFFGSLQIVRLMLRHNSIERVSNGWLAELENSLVEVYIVEPQLRSIPVESLNGLINLIAITIHSDELKHLPDFSGLLSLTYLSVQSKSMTELQPHWFRHLPKVQNIHINGGPNLNRLEAGLFDGLISLKNIDLSRNGINWMHLRALYHLPNLVSLKLSHNQISDVGMIGRIVKDLENLKKLRLDHNIINIVAEGSFVDLPHLTELHLNDNRITEIQYGAFHRTPMLKLIYLHNNHIRRVHPESFLQSSGGGVENVYIYNNEIDNVDVLRSLLNALPTLKFLDMSNNFLTDIAFGTLRGHGTIEQLHLNNNLLRSIDRDSLMAMPALRELRMRNNSLSSQLPVPFWNLPGLKGLDLSLNQFRTVDALLLAGLPSLRRLDLSENSLMRMDPATFLYNPMLETLNISANELTVIHPALFRNLDRLFEVDVSFNVLTDIVPGLPKIVERVSMRGNRIIQLPASVSKLLNLPNLRMLDMSENGLEHIPKYTFLAVHQLRVLSLANNRLRSLEDTTFMGASRLELLHLQDNQISSVDERAFLALGNLRNLNMQGNKLEGITDNMFSNNSLLEQLDLARNSIRDISPVSFESQKSLEYLDLSSNVLGDISVSLSNLLSLRDIDLSNNQLSQLHSNVISSWRNVVEIRLANNLIVELKHGTFRNLPKLQYLDLSSNKITAIDPGALKNLPELQEFVLADNSIVELKDHVFEDLPNLLASHFQHNNLRYISPESFYNSPSLVFFNLSNNNFRNMENIGLRSMRNLEVLDLSSNAVRTVSTMPLQALNWLVELKIDDNRICKIQGSPFETMPRLRVLSMRNNRLRTIQERTFRNLRGNIAILDVDGNPIDCSCEMQWLTVWLQETNFPYPGPKCPDGRLMRMARMEKSLCVGGRGGSESDQRSGTSYLPLLNEHGDVFTRQLHDDLNDDCDAFERPANLGHNTSEDDEDKHHHHQRPLPGESEYFYDQYIDYPPHQNVTTTLPTASTDDGPTPTPYIDFNNIAPALSNKRPTPSQTPAISNIDHNKTLLNTKYFNRHPPLGGQQAQSSFTFFGYPISNIFGNNHNRERARKDHGESLKTYTSPRAKVRMFQANGDEFEKYLNQDTQYNDVTSRNHNVELGSDEAASNEERNVFKTSFREPTSVERGGFKPIVPERIGGFIPLDPNRRGGVIPLRVDITERNLIPVITETPSSTVVEEIPEQELVEETSSFESATQTHYYDTHQRTPISTLSPNHKILSTTQRSTSPPITEYTSTTDEYKHSSWYDDNEDLEAQQDIGRHLPTSTPSPSPTTSETILLIPPTEEHVEQYKKNSWVSTNDMTTKVSSTSPMPTTSTQRNSRPAGGRSTITKVFAPQTLQQYLPTAEEYYRTTPETGDFVFNSNTPSKELKLTDEKNVSPENAITTEAVTTDPMRKYGMDWYYDSFKRPDRDRSFASNQVFSAETSLQSGNLQSRKSGAVRNIISDEPAVRLLLMITIAVLLL